MQIERTKIEKEIEKWRLKEHHINEMKNKQSSLKNLNELYEQIKKKVQL